MQAIIPEYVQILNWWLLLFCFGLVSIPVSHLLFRKFFDAGYGLSKTIGILIVSYLAFVGGILKIIPFTRFTLAIIGCLYIFANMFLYYKNSKQIVTSLRKKLKIILFSELLFTSSFALWTIVRGYHPDINGLEKFMDFGFINSILRSEFLPPVDMWFSGSTINYYWFGHFITALLTKISNIPSSITYNLMIATILGLALSAAFSISSTLISSLGLKRPTKLGLSAGIISALLLVYAGNLHTPIYVLKEGRDKYWYPDATRFIGYNPDTNDKTIHEFPIYSFVVSDLHAHLINFPFVLLYLAFLWRLLEKGKGKFETTTLVPLGFVLGTMFITNAWDFANYTLATGFVLLFNNLSNIGLRISSLINTAIKLTIILVVSGLTALPFILNFKSVAEGISLVNSHTPLWQLGVLWGFPAILTLVFWLATRTKAVIHKSDIFVTALLVTSWTLILLPEIIFLKDIYIASHHRANTMFKLTYQAYVMFYLSSGYITVRVLASITKRPLRFLASIAFVIVFYSLLSYSYIATKGFYGDFESYKGVVGDTWLLRKHPELYKTVKWFKQNTGGQPVILEAPGDSYTEYNVVSAYTGLPTVSGWFVHEWLWRGGADVPQARVADITQIYTSTDIDITKHLIAKYNISYIIIGSFEREKYPNLEEEKFKQIGVKVFASGSTSIYKI